MSKPEEGTMVEVIEIDSDTEEVNGTMLALCDEANNTSNELVDVVLEYGEVNASNELVDVVIEYGEVDTSGELVNVELEYGEVDTSRELVNVVLEYGEVNTSRELVNGEATNRTSNMQIVCVDDCSIGDDCDLEYMKFLVNVSENGNPYLLEDGLRDDSPLRIMYDVDAEEFKKKKRKAKSLAGSSGLKKVKIEKGGKDRKLISKTEKKKHKKEVAGKGKKLALITEPKKRGRPRKVPVTENNLKVSKKQKKKEKKNAKRKAKAETMLRAPKRLKIENGRVDHKSSISKTIPVGKTKDIKRKKITVTKHNLETKATTSHAKAREKENEESRSLLDKSYAYYLGYLRKAVTIFDANRQVTVVKDIVALSDPDIVAVSDRPFAYGSKSIFETNKDGKVIDVEKDAIDVFNTSFSKKLMELLRKPYAKEDLVRLYEAASFKRPLTRSRQLRDGREIEYNVDHQFAPSLLDQYPDFNKKLSRYRKDPVKALNLLRGFLFYFENIILEGAFKPWLHEKSLEKMFSDPSICKSIECTPHSEALES